MTVKRYIIFFVFLFFIDWALGVLQAGGIISYLWFLIFNIPFGIPFVIIETHWAGTNYKLFGLKIGEEWSLAAWLFAVLGQAWFYLLLYHLLRREKNISHLR